MSYNPAKHHRRTIRMPGHDYSAGAYFVTLVTHNRAELFGVIKNGVVTLSAYGQIAHDEWLRSVHIRSEIEQDAFVVMPNHIHMIIVLLGSNLAPEQAATKVDHKIRRVPKSLGSVLAGYKASVTSKINEFRKTPGEPIWQRNYHEHFIRDDRERNAIRTYITNNPTKWSLDHP